MRIFVLGAGGPAGVNTVRALKLAEHYVIGCDSNPFHLAWPDCWMMLSPVPDVDWINGVVRENEIELIFPQPDSLVRFAAEHRNELAAPVCLPRTETIALCQDKAEAAEAWCEAGLHGPVFRLDEYEDLVQAEEHLGWPLWIRASRGAGARGATRADNMAVVEAWLAYWHARGEGWRFIAEEYLPGRDYAWAGIYDHGELISSFARERLEYIYPELSPSGRTGTPSVARTVHDQRVNTAAEAAIEILDSAWHGLASVDLREDILDNPQPTEINAGRTSTTTPLYAELGCNLPALLVRLAQGETDFVTRRNAVPAGVLLTRHIDCRHVFDPLPLVPGSLAAEIEALTGV